jgi:hypothetical protein
VAVTNPRYRASLLKSVLAMIEEDYPEQKDEILAGIDPDFLETIAQVSRADWVDARGMFSINAGIHAALGGLGFAKFWIDFSRTATRVPMLKSLAEGAARLFGSGKGIVKLLPRSFDMVSRDLAVVTLRDLEAGLANLEFTDFQSEDYFDLFVEANRASIQGAMMMVGEDPTVEVVESDPKTGRAWLRVMW